MKQKKKLIIGLSVLAFLLVYSLGYALCRKTKTLVHTACVLNVDFHGRYHMIHIGPDDSALANLAGSVFWPLREIEARYHGRDGRRD
jgi:hypothetical protein